MSGQLQLRSCEVERVKANCNSLPVCVCVSLCRFLFYEITSDLRVEPREISRRDLRWVNITLKVDRYTFVLQPSSLFRVSLLFSYKKKKNRYLAQLIVLRRILRHVYYENNRRRIVALLLFSRMLSPFLFRKSKSLSLSLSISYTPRPNRSRGNDVTPQ